MCFKDSKILIIYTNYFIDSFSCIKNRFISIYFNKFMSIYLIYLNFLNFLLEIIFKFIIVYTQ